MKSLTGLWKATAEDFSAICDTPIDRDFKTILDRVEDEGISFLTITLPSFAADFESSLDNGEVGSHLFIGFKKRKGLPRFLSGFLLRIFDGQTCKLLDDPDIFAIKAVRQLCLLFKKIELDCTPERVDRALDAYITCEEDLKITDSSLSQQDRDDFAKTAAVLFGSVFNSLNRDVQEFNLDPAHGPGATADRKIGNQKFVQSEWTDRLEEYFPYGEYVLHNWRYFKSNRPNFLSPEQERPVRVITVPKTLKTPRIIAIEPTAMQYMQQSLMRRFVEEIESDPLVSSFTHFTDQSLNQGAACEASRSGLHATLDLSEASDRVLNSLVIGMLKPWSDLSGAVQACRSTRAELPSGTIVSLTKFASMGSALTFPMEAIVFTTIVTMGIAKAQGVNPWNSRFLESLKGHVHVYGDDMIVPVESVNSVIGSLETFGLKVNHTKSFWTGMFRESCGGDYFNGHRVNPIRLKHIPPISRQSVSEVLAWNSFMNRAYDAGYMRAGQYAQKVIEKALGTRLSHVPLNSGAVGIQTDSRLISPECWDTDTFAPLVRAWVPENRQKEISVDDHWALRKVFTGRWSDPMFRKHLSHSGRSLSSRMKRVWVSAT